MNILIDLVIAILVGCLAWVLLNIFPPTRTYSGILSLVVAILTFLFELGVVH